MKRSISVLILLFSAPLFTNLFAQPLPLVYSVENTAASYPIPFMPSFTQLPVIPSFPDPFQWQDGRGKISHFVDWEYRRAEIGAQIQNYEIGIKPPRPDTITASFSGGVLTVNVTVNGQTLTLTSAVVLPAGPGPFPAVIGMNSPSGSIPQSIFTSRNIAMITFSHNQVTTYGGPKATDPYYRIYPNLNPTNTGQYSGWAWGVSRIIDGLELTQATLPVDLKHIAVTGCSYAGKLALFAGALDERVALTIAQESGGGGATSWRYSHSLPSGTVELIDNTDYNWFEDAMQQFGGNNVASLPEDHHELMALCAPRALYVTANPDYTWLSNPSCDVCSRACQQIYNTLGIGDRFGFSIVGGHSHCAVPDNQIPEMGAFVDKFLLGIDTVNTNFSDSPYSIDLSPWITWTNPVLTSGSSFNSWATLVYPPNLQSGLDTTVTFKWTKANGAAEYLFQLSPISSFTSYVIFDSTADTSKTVSGLSKSKLYYWRVQAKGTSESGPWSTVQQMITAGPLPGKPELIPVTTPDSSRSGNVGYKFTWKRLPYTDHYFVQFANDSLFITINTSHTVSDTVDNVFGFVAGAPYYWRVRGSNAIGNGPWSDEAAFPQAAALVERKAAVPHEYSLSQNYPNPFNPSTHFRFSIADFQFVELKVLDELGRELATLVHEYRQPGEYEIAWDGAGLASGMYFYRIRAGGFVQTRKMVLMK